MKQITQCLCLLFAVQFVSAQSNLFTVTGFSIKAADAKSKTGLTNGSFSTPGALDESTGSTDWQKQAFVTITDIAVENDYNNFHLTFTGTDGTLQSADNQLSIDKQNHKISFVLKDLVNQANNGMFTLSYPDSKTTLGTFTFTIKPASTDHKTPPPIDPTDPSTDIDLYKDALNFVGNLSLNQALKYDSRYNAYRKKDKKVSDVVVIYVDANGDLLYTPVPTTGIRNFKYEIHLIKRSVDKNSYALVRPEGGITDAFNVYSNGTPSMPGVAKASAAQPADANKSLEERVYPAIGPYEADFKISLMRTNAANNKSSDLIGSTVKVATFYYASIQVGLLATTLRNPQNITKSALPNGDSTLVADDPFTRGIFSVMAVFYPKGRSFLFPPSGGIFSAERFGIVVGTQLDKTQFQNFLGGLQFDFARGGSVSFGAHYGRRTTIQGYKDFNFGTDVFVGDLASRIKQEWNLGFFFGVNVDVKIFNYLFGTSSSSGSSGN
jgi:hypothetical protein